MNDAQKTPTTTNDELQPLLEIAVTASKKAGDIILGNAGGAAVTKSKANSRDLLTLVDPLCEKVRGFGDFA
jgi:myo-inositol-1(or 4)-monophosphatase